MKVTLWQIKDIFHNLCAAQRNCLIVNNDGLQESYSSFSVNERSPNNSYILDFFISRLLKEKKTKRKSLSIEYCCMSDHHSNKAIKDKVDILCNTKTWQTDFYKYSQYIQYNI